MSKLHTAPSDQIAGSSHQAVLQPANGITSLLACSKPANEQNRKENKQLTSREEDHLFVEDEADAHDGLALPPSHPVQPAPEHGESDRCHSSPTLDTLLDLKQPYHEVVNATDGEVVEHLHLEMTRGEGTPVRSRAASNPIARGQEIEAGGGAEKREREDGEGEAYEELDLLAGVRFEGRFEAKDLQRSLLVAPGQLKQLGVRGRHRSCRVVVPCTVVDQAECEEGRGREGRWPWQRVREERERPRVEMEVKLGC
ncbi:unnamed protein product [Miscanthus lutarioriparius]|uniref:Uncharacterized protein n=1 Tax=Miscanthus lutarioriparius TaxID=422564 RepID=A0A811Q839_9POAL|nr:unnamed protein product [Miscanthus lutarioriparius]